MARLIHLNGPPGIGKSTLAQRYADNHPGVLNLDIDRLRPLIGGWQGRFAETGEIVRPLALVMARTHLDTGADVVLPQYLGRLTEIERFERVAHDSGGTFHEIVLLDVRERAVDRFYARGADAAGGNDAWHDEVKRVVAADGGRTALEAMYDGLVSLIPYRPRARVIDNPADGIDAAYDALLTAAHD